MKTFQENNEPRDYYEIRGHEEQIPRSTSQNGRTINERIDSLNTDLLEQRLRSIEMQMMQNMCISTAISTHLALQSRNGHPENHGQFIQQVTPNYPHFMGPTPERMSQ